MVWGKGQAFGLTFVVCDMLCFAFPVFIGFKSLKSLGLKISKVIMIKATIVYGCPLRKKTSGFNLNTG